MTAPRTKTLKKKADALFSKIIRARGRCERCGRQAPEVTLQCAHILSRKYTATRWLDDNCFCLCSGCHFWGHQNPAEWGLWIVEVKGAEAIEALRAEALSYPGRVKKVDYEELIADLTARLEELDAA